MKNPLLQESKRYVTGSRRVIHGGAFYTDSRYTEVAFRNFGIAPTQRFHGLGFRLFRTQGES